MKRIVVLGNMAGLGGALANRLAGLGHEAMALPGAPAPEIVVALRPEVLIIVGQETAISTRAVEEILREIGAAAVVVAAPGDPWAAWAESARYPMMLPERAVEEIPSHLPDLIELKSGRGAGPLPSSGLRGSGGWWGSPRGSSGSEDRKGGPASPPWRPTRRPCWPPGASRSMRSTPSPDTRGNMIDFLRVVEGDPVYSLVDLAAVGPPRP